MSRYSSLPQHNGYHEIGATAAGVMANDPTVVPQGILILTKAMARCNEIMDKIVADSNLLARSTVKNEAQGFKAVIQGMVVQLITPGRDGIYSWQKNPALINSVANAVDQQAIDMNSNKEELLGVSSNLKQFASLLGEKATEVAAAAAKALVEGAKKGFKESDSKLPLLVVGGLVAVLAAAYVARSFR